MAQQLTLDGVNTAIMGRDKLLVAIYPEVPGPSRIETIARNLRAVHGLTGNLRKTEIFHITLCDMGDYDGLPKDIVDRAKEAAATVKARSFEVTLDRAMSFRGSGAYVLLARESDTTLKAFRESLFTALKIHGPICQIAPGFTPHVTMLYADHLVPEHPIEPLSWKVREFVLIHSLLGQTKHIPLARWPLSD